MSWQSQKDKGEPIYVLSRSYRGIEMMIITRVSYWKKRERFASMRHVVRFKNLWHRLYPKTDLLTRYKKPDGRYETAYFQERKFKRTDTQLPFIRAWERDGEAYQPYGY